MNRPGPLNLITDVSGVKVGQAQDESVRSGVTVVLPDAAAVASVDVRGGGPGTRETDALRPEATVEHVHAIVLSGGSAFGLDAATGAMSWLAAEGRGFEIAGQVVPIVPAAILFDLANGGDKSWAGDLSAAATPYRRLAIEAMEGATKDIELGNAGAGYGAVAGELKGGVGSASIVLEDGVTVGALVAVNAFGSTVIPGTRTFWAWALERDGELGGQVPPATGAELDLDYWFDPGAAGRNTSLGVVATDAALTKTQARRIAVMAQDGLARAIRPVHTPLDGDTIFVLATGEGEADAGHTPDLGEIARIGAAAADCVARAAARGVYEARGLWGVPGYETL